jgi:polysaccharide pyruvyl transferase WcaK-like protein
MRILIENGSHRLDNLGDLAMLQGAYNQLQSLWPNAEIMVVSHDQSKLNLHIPGATAVNPPFTSWFSRINTLNFLHKPIASRLIQALSLTAKLPPGSLSRTMGILEGVDLVVMAGSGILADPFSAPAMLRLHLLRTAQDYGIPTALMGQGVGPLENAGLRNMVGEVFSQAGLISLRERKYGPRLLEEIGVTDIQPWITGDESLGLAHRDAVPRGRTDSIGLNLRLTSYTQLAQFDGGIQQLGRMLNTAIKPLPASIIPISIHQIDHDNLQQGFSQLPLPERGSWHSHSLPQALREISGCRVVITSSYHAAVFALALGIPVVCLAASRYYRWKFHGLADLFPEGCEVVDLAHEEAAASLIETLEDLWASAATLKPVIWQRVEEQILWSETAYQQLAALLS